MKTQNRIAPVVIAFSIICLYAVTTIAQSSKTSSPLGIGTIKDYPATGLMTGCGNLYFHQRGQTTGTDSNYVFLARADGSDAWINLNGRDIRLQQIKRASTNQRPRRFAYRYGKLQITVVIEDFNPRVGDGESDPMYQMKITVRRGRAAQVIQAVGDADC